MQRPSPLAGHPFCLAPGTRVHEWRLEGCHGHGAFGVVYRALRVGRQAEGPVALKLALFAWDPRFMREVGLLSLIHHPSIPRLLGHGFWQHPSGTFFPFIIMDWVEGPPLYEWDREHAPTPLQVLQVLAQLARALEATHACCAVHRDVKGDNVRVRRSDGRAVLLDFGAGHYQSAARQTWQPLPPGTPPYRSPEAWLFARRSEHAEGARYLAGPADDVYALGVTAYRLVTGEYPPGHALRRDEGGAWHLEEMPLPSPRELNPRVDPQLSALILRMLSLSPEARGSAGEIAEALEAAAERAAKGAGKPRPCIESSASSAAPGAFQKRTGPRGQATEWRPRSAWLLVGALLVLGAWQTMRAHVRGAPMKEQVATSQDHKDEGTANLGEAGPGVTSRPVQEPSQREAISQASPPQPFPGQLAPDAKGRCPGSKQTPINGGCWVESPTKDAEECEKNDLVFIKGRCYAPVMGSRRKPPPTSAPPDFR